MAGLSPAPSDEQRPATPRREERAAQAGPPAHYRRDASDRRPYLRPDHQGHAAHRSQAQRRSCRGRDAHDRTVAKGTSGRSRESHCRISGQEPRRRSRPSYPASGTISAGLLPSLRISIVSHVFDPARPGPGDIIYDQQSYDRFHRLRLDNKPALVFAAHLANWELPSYVAAAFKLDAHVLYRRPNVGPIAEAVARCGSETMGTLVPAGFDAPLRLLRVLEAGGHVGMLVDQHFRRGVDVTFFGRRCKVNPLLARLAAQIECPILRRPRDTAAAARSFPGPT